MRIFSVVPCLVLGLLVSLPCVNAAWAQEPPPYDASPQGLEEGTRYPALGQGDTTPGTPNLPRDLELTVAAGVGYAPEYMGADDKEAIFVPAVDFEYKDRAFLVINRDAMMVPYEGLGLKLLANQDFSIGVNATYEERRDDDNDHIRGIGEVDWAGFAGGFAAWHPGIFFVRGQIGADMFGEYDNSFKGDIGVGVAGPLNPYLRGRVELSSAFAGEDYLDNYFGITSGQSARSGLKTFSPDGMGFYKTTLAGTLQYNITQGAFIQGIAKYDMLTGDAADSPIVEDENAFTVMGTAGYKF